jgi:hypothetical protein
METFLLCLRRTQYPEAGVEMILTHLTAVGPSVPPASVEFGIGLTVIYGASDTGKSYIAQAIDFVTGGSNLKRIPEGEGYTNLLLGIALPDGQNITLVRPMTGDVREHKVAVFPGKHRQVPAEPPDMLLAPKHNPRSTQNISRFLLGEIGLDGKLIRRNAQDERRLLSFRDLARLCIIDETDMQSQTSPILSGQYVTATAEKSVFKLLVDGHDDSDLVGPSQSPDQRKVSRGKAELLDQLIGELHQAVTDSMELVELRRQHAQVISSIEALSESVTAAVRERDRLLAARDDARARISADRARLAEISELVARFNLLREQYDSDLARLDMVREVGDLLGYFDRGVCVFCGAAVEDQHPPSGHVISELTELAEAVNAERAKTVSLREDLNVTLMDVASQGREVQGSLENWQGTHEQLDAILTVAEQDLAPKDQELTELLATRSNVEKEIATHEQIERLELLRGDFAVLAEPAESNGRDVSTHELAALGAQIATLLAAWGVPDSTTVDFDRETFDLIVNGQARRNRGKGIRAVFHAAYTLGLALHCLANHQAHPGFLVLDSPLITYRGPDSAVSMDADDEFVTQTVADAFFRYLALNSVGQVIVLENTDPPTDIEKGVTYFTKSQVTGRYGFFPPASSTGPLW